MNLAHLISDGNGDESLYVTHLQAWLSETFLKDLSSCLSAKRKFKDFILSQPHAGRKLKFYGSCAQAERSNISKYEIPEYYKFQVNWIELKYGAERTGVEPGAYIPIVPAHFSTKFSCEQNGKRHLIQIKGWNIDSYTTRKHKFKSKYICIKTSNL